MSPDHWSKLTWDTVSAGGYDLFGPIGYLDRIRDRACKQRVIVTPANALHPHPLEADSATHHSQAGFFIKDELSDYRFLVDTGAFRSILPPSRDNPSIYPSSSQLVAANGTSIRTYGEQEVSIRLSGRTYSWTFIIADVRHPLLGADFLSHFNLVVDVARHRLLDTDSFTSVPLCISNIEANINLLSPDDNYSDIIKDFDNVFKPELRLSPGTAAKRGERCGLFTRNLVS